MTGKTGVPKQTAWQNILKRSFDIVLAGGSLLVFCLPMLIIALMVKLTSRGPAFYWSDRVGRNNDIFSMPKFRTMRIDTPPVATHLMKHPEEYRTSIGGLLRELSLDELPQLFSIIKGDMSLVGPRPALFNQDDLVKLRTERGIHLLTPGVTGWAQINGRDDLPISVKVDFDEYYLQHRSFGFDFRIFVRTALYVIRHKGVVH